MKYLKELMIKKLKNSFLLVILYPIILFGQDAWDWRFQDLIEAGKEQGVHLKKKDFVYKCYDGYLYLEHKKYRVSLPCLSNEEMISCIIKDNKIYVRKR